MRPNHKAGHPECPHPNWAACDRAVASRFGACKAMVEPKGKEPRQCSNNALEEDGWCGVHFASEIERIRKAERAALVSADLNARIEAHIAMTAANPLWWLDQIKPSLDAERGLPPYSKASPTVVNPLRSAPRRKGPHRVG